MRDGTPTPDPSASAGFAVLLQRALREAERLLTTYGEFWPFAAVVTQDGVVQAVMSRPPGDEAFPPPESVREALVGALVEHRALYRATVIVGNATAPDGDDLVRLEFEDEDGATQGLLVPYRRHLPGRPFRYLKQRLALADPQIWP